MDLILTRLESRPEGIFGELTAKGNKQFFCTTLEHAYLINGEYLPKLKKGIYKCVRGMHKLESMEHPFETFEIMGVEGHYGILFHVGNYGTDSSGCVLVGSGLGFTLRHSKMITSSAKAFRALMELQKECNEFTLFVDQ